ncbi:hypothetical protein BC831DRAFT_467997 [Entophlyctis helioformis]|nr:hypothetical protein BC831DRAFT_467997 [Entophlyctis helioformis]
MGCCSSKLDSLCDGPLVPAAVPPVVCSSARGVGHTSGMDCRVTKDTCPSPPATEQHEYCVASENTTNTPPLAASKSSASLAPCASDTHGAFLTATTDTGETGTLSLLCEALSVLDNATPTLERVKDQNRSVMFLLEHSNVTVTAASSPALQRANREPPIGPSCSIALCCTTSDTALKRTGLGTNTPSMSAATLPNPAPPGGYILRFLDGQMDTNDPNLRLVWNEAFTICWSGDLADLPYAVQFGVDGRDGTANMTLVADRGMYARLLDHFKHHAIAKVRLHIDRSMANYAKAAIFPADQEILNAQLRHIPMRQGWTDLIDFTHPVALGWIAIKYGHPKLLKHLVKHYQLDLAKYKRLKVGNTETLAMDLAANHDDTTILDMLRTAKTMACSPAPAPAPAPAAEPDATPDRVAAHRRSPMRKPPKVSPKMADKTKQGVARHQWLAHACCVA